MKRVIDIYIVVVAAVLVVLSIAIYFAPHVGWRMNNVVSGSMSPTLEVGTMVISRTTIDPAKFKVGDIIIFKSPESGKSEVAHRIVSIGTALPLTFKTKGDAYPAPDPWTVAAASITGKVEFTIPIVGYYVSFLKTSLGLMVGLLFPALIILVICFRYLWREVVKYIRAQIRNEKT